MGLSLSQWATIVQFTGTLLLPFSQITLSWPRMLSWGWKLRGRSVTVMAANMALMSSWDMWAFPEMPGYLLHQQMIYWQAGVNTAVTSCVWAKQPWVRANRWDAGGHPNSFLCLPGAATGTTAATTRQRRKAATPRCSATSGRVSRTLCGVVRKGWLLSRGFPSLTLSSASTRLTKEIWGPQRQVYVCQAGFKAALGNVCSLPSSLPIPCQELESWSPSTTHSQVTWDLPRLKGRSGGHGAHKPS